MARGVLYCACEGDPRAWLSDCPHISYLGYPVSVPCAGHAGLGFRASPPRRMSPAAGGASRGGSSRGPADAVLRDADGRGVETHVAGIWQRPAWCWPAHDGPLWDGPLHRARAGAGGGRAGARGDEAESGSASIRRCGGAGVGTYLVQTAGDAAGAARVARLRAYTMPGNASFLALARGAAAEVEAGPDEVEVVFDAGARPGLPAPARRASARFAA